MAVTSTDEKYSQESHTGADTDIKMDTMNAAITGRKRPHSPQNMEEPAPEETQTASIPTSTPIRALLLHFNTLICSKEAISHVIRKTLSAVLPAADIRQPLLDEHIVQAFARAPAITGIVRDLALRDLTADEMAHLAECYSRIYYEEGTPLARLAFGAEEFLKDVAALRKRQEENDGGSKMAVAVLSNNTLMAEDMLGRLGVRELVDAILPSPKPQNPYSVSDESTSVWEQAVVPWFAEFCGASDSVAVKPLLPEQAVMVSCAPYDLFMAKAVGCKACWIRKIDPDTDVAVRAAAEFPSVVESMGELWMELFGEHLTEDNKEHPAEDDKEHPTEDSKEQPGGEEYEEEKMEGIESEYEQEPWIL